MQQNNTNPFNWNIGELSNAQDKSQEQIVIEDIFFNMFSTEHGQKALDFLKKKFVNPRISYPELGLNGVFYSYERGGQISVIKTIEALIEASENRRKKGA